jgi:lysophospholipid acyltransferase (LPLAT)-like uncharacterized protein
MKLRDPKSIRRAAAVAAFAVRGLAHSYRFAYRPLTSYVVNDRPELLDGANYIYAFWHEHIIMPVSVYARPDTAVLIGQHADGELITQVAERFGMAVMRGSTTRGGTAAMLRMLRNGWGKRHLAITPDGPRGPRRKCQFGTVYLASRTGLPIAPVGFGFSRCFRARSWDRFAVPLPLTRVRSVSAHPIFVPPGLGTDELKPYQSAVEEATNIATSVAENWAETGTFDPLGYQPPKDAKLVIEHQKVWSSARLTVRSGI